MGGIDWQTSQRVRRIPEAHSIYMNQLVYAFKRRGIRITTLSLGEAFFDMPFLSMDGIDFASGYHYSDSRGLPELREKIAEVYRERYHVSVDPAKEILVTAGSKIAIYLAMLATLNEGDEVLLPEPAWLSYVEQIKLVGAIPRFIPYHCAVSDYAGYFTERTRMIVINNPNNPSGRVYTRSELQGLHDACAQRGIYVLSDEAYSDFIGQDSFCALSSLSEHKKGLITVNSLSKNLGVSGWRIGYIIADPDLIFDVYKLNQHLITCAPTLLQMYLAKHYDALSDVVAPQIQATVEKRRRVQAVIERLGLRCLPGSSTFYFFLDIGAYRYTSTELAMYLLMKYQISVVPGSAYGKSTERFVRISVGTESEESIERALRTIRQVIENDEYSQSDVEERLRELGMEAFGSVPEGRDA